MQSSDLRITRPSAELVLDLPKFIEQKDNSVVGANTQFLVIERPSNRTNLCSSIL